MIVPCYYEDLEILHDNTMPARAYYIPASKKMDDLIEHRETSDRFQLLDKNWKFQYFESIYDVKDRFFETGYDTSGFEDLNVLHAWQLFGHDVPQYTNIRYEILAVMRQAKHEPPHLHHALELVWVKSGSLELGMGEELYHMQAGDVGILFPDLIHHYQVFSAGQNMAVFVNAPPFIVGAYEETLNQKAPKIPVLKASVIPEDVCRSFDALLTTKDIPIAQAYLQIILARCIKELTLTEKSNVESEDLIYRTVAYVSAHFNHAVSLEEMAKALGVSKYVLSRIFSKTFHRNFNQYLNDARLGFACQRLETTNDTITEICLDSGFESQRTFNRAFKERFKMSPSQYRILQQRQQEEKEEQYGVFDNDDQGTEKHCTDRT